MPSKEKLLDYYKGWPKTGKYYDKLNDIYNLLFDYLVHFPRQKNKKYTVIFDIDDTLFHSKSKVLVKKDGKTVKELEPAEYNVYKLEPGETYDFSQFRSSKIFYDTARPIETVFKLAKRMIAQFGKYVNKKTIPSLIKKITFDKKVVNEDVNIVLVGKNGGFIEKISIRDLKSILNQIK